MTENPMNGEGSSFWTSKHFSRIQVAFWITFFLLPFFTGLLAYKWLPNESYDERDHVALNSYEVEDREGNITEIVAIWEDRKTGVSYTEGDFVEHRHSEANRLTAVWFAYGLVGCCFFACTQYAQTKSSFYSAFGRASLINIAVAVYAWFATAS